MSFEQYTATAQGYRAKLDNHISVGKSRIGLGTYKLPFEYAVIHFDREAPAIMFTKGHSGNGFKVQTDGSGKTTYLAAKSFTTRKYIPYGTYKRTNDKEHVFVLSATKDEGES